MERSPTTETFDEANTRKIATVFASIFEPAAEFLFHIQQAKSLYQLRVDAHLNDTMKTTWKEVSFLTYSNA